MRACWSCHKPIEKWEVLCSYCTLKAAAEPEVILLQVRPSIRYQLITNIGGILTAISLGAAWFGFVVLLGRVLPRLFGDFGSAVALALAMLTILVFFVGGVTVLYLLYVQVRTPREIYQVTSTRVRHLFSGEIQQGHTILDRLDFYPDSESVMLGDITTVTVSQGYFGKLLGYGNLTVLAESPRARITMTGILEPLRVKDRLELVISKFGGTLKTPPLVTSARTVVQGKHGIDREVVGVIVVLSLIVSALSLLIYYGPYFASATIHPGETRDVPNSLDLVIFGDSDFSWTESDTSEIQVTASAAQDEIDRMNNAINANPRIISVNVVGHNPQILNIKYSVTVSVLPGAPSGSLQLFVRFTHPKIVPPRIKNEPVGRLKIEVR